MSFAAVAESEVIDKLRRAQVDTLSPIEALNLLYELKQKLIDFGVEPVGSTSAEFAALIQSETTRWHKLIKDLGITLD